MKEEGRTTRQSPTLYEMLPRYLDLQLPSTMDLEWPLELQPECQFSYLSLVESFCV